MRSGNNSLVNLEALELDIPSAIPTLGSSNALAYVSTDKPYLFSITALSCNSFYNNI